MLHYNKFCTNFPLIFYLFSELQQLNKIEHQMDKVASSYYYNTESMN